MFDPIAEKRNQKYTREELAAFFKGSGSVAQRLRMQNPEKYAEIRRSAEAMGIVGPSLIGTPAPPTPYRPPTRSYTPAELESRGKYSESEIRAFFADAKKANDLFHSDRNEYEARRDAGVSYGLFQKRETPYIPTKPVAVLPDLHRISNELALESNLPIGTSVPWAQYELLIQQKIDRARKVQADADAKLEADRLAELEKLTARQQADEAERARKQRDLDRLVELTAPKPITPPEDPALAVQRALAAEKLLQTKQAA